MIRILYVIIVCMPKSVTFTCVFVHTIIIFFKKEVNPLSYEIKSKMKIKTSHIYKSFHGSWGFSTRVFSMARGTVVRDDQLVI